MKIRKIVKRNIPTGVWNAIEQDRAAGNIRYRGCIFNWIAISPRTGNITEMHKHIVGQMFHFTQISLNRLPLATATFDANSVNICANKQIRNNKTIVGKPLRPDNASPNISAMPEALPPFANANPPPSRKIKLHGIFALIYFHVIKLGVVAFGSLSGRLPQQNFNQFQLAGNMNNAITMKIAGVASPILITFLLTISSAHPGKNPIAR